MLSCAERNSYIGKIVIFPVECTRSFRPFRSNKIPHGPAGLPIICKIKKIWEPDRGRVFAPGGDKDRRCYTEKITIFSM